MSLALLVIEGPDQGKRFPLKNGRFLIGRGEQVDIQILSHQMSREHAELIVDQQSLRIYDRGSANGTAVNGRFVTTALLKHGDTLTLGDVVFSVLAPKVVSTPEPDVKHPAHTGLMLAATKVVSDRLRPKALWPLFTVGLSLALVGTTLMTALAFKSMTRDRIYRMSMSRAHDLVRLLSERNKEDLKYNNHLLLDVETVKKERGVREAYIIGEKGRILAPINLLNRIDTDPAILEALVSPHESRILPVPGAEPGTFTFLHPIRAYDEKNSRYQVLGVAKLIFNPAEAVGSISEANQLMMLMIMLSLGLAIFLGWLLTRLLSAPMDRLAERIHQWRTGQVFQKETAPYQEWSPLYEAVDRALEDVDT